MLKTTNKRIRILDGIAREQRIISFLSKKHKFKIRNSSKYQDITLGIDCFITLNNKEYSTQIKFREVGKDITYELFSDYYNQVPGKDTKATAEIYLIVIKNKLLMLHMSQVKKIALELHDMVKENMDCTQNTSYDIYYKGVVCQLKIKYDVDSNKCKLLAYIPKKLFTDLLGTIFVCNIDVT